MKRLIPILSAAFVFATCERGPSMDKLDSDCLIYTNYDRKADFKQFSTYHIPDSVFVIGDKKNPEHWKGEAAVAIINIYEDNLSNRGFAYTDNEGAVNLGVQISYVQSIYYFVDYGQPGWWWDYPGYWNVSHRGNWGGWYYPYVVNYSITTNSSPTEIMNLKAPEGDNQKLPVLWNSFSSGPASYPGKVNQTLAVHVINQSFAQSPYLTNK